MDLEIYNPGTERKTLIGWGEGRLIEWGEGRLIEWGEGAVNRVG